MLSWECVKGFGSLNVIWQVLQRYLLEIQDSACPVDECGMSEFAWVISMNMRLSVAIRADAVSVNKTDFNDHRTVGLIEGK